ncbi:MAG: outer membrane beta-barrel protein [Verrucomicrobia bacterium]|nr:outer membrane beta-barrel protein [Verrucomicrobiota bacterium]
MKLNQWTVGLAAAGVISLASAVNAEEAASQVMTALSSTTLSGYVDTSAIWKFGTGANVVGRSYDGPAKQDGFNLNVVKVSLEKPLDEGQWSAGYKVDFLVGPDAGTFGSNIKQAYVALRVPVGNGVDVKMGVWDTIIGYEVFDAGSNPNYSRSFGYLLEPTTYTGLQASYKVADWMSVTAGVADPGVGFGINNRSQIESVKSYMASVVFTAPESWGSLKGAALYAGIVDHGKQVAPSVDTQNYYVGVTTPTGLEGLSVGASYDYQGFSHRDGFNPSGYANAASFYTTYKHDKWSFNNRFEYATSGNSYNPFGVSGYYYPGEVEDSLASAAATTNHHPQLIGETFTVDYSLWANVISRVEFRWDHDLRGGPGGTFATDHYPLGQKNALSLALNVIYKF